MAFPEDVVRQAWQRAGARCECERQQCPHHQEKHNRSLWWEHRGKETEYGWESHHKNKEGGDVLSNCEILCQDCHKATQSYGG